MTAVTRGGAAVALALTLVMIGAPARAEPIFLRGASESSITEVVPPWTQSSACDCCVCWETALGTVLSYWDDFGNGVIGPWEQIVTSDDRFDADAFASLTNELWVASDLDCDAGGVSFFIFDDVMSAARSVTNDDRGYDFSYDYDEWVWFGSDIVDEIQADRPVYYRFSDDSSPEPEGWQETEGHAITIVGVDPDTEVLYVYGNWDEVLNHRGFDDADDHGTMNIEPGGTDCNPDSHTGVETSCGVGACQSVGWLECDDTGFFFDSCEPGAAEAEDLRCDGVDEDCDGAFDEDYLPRVTECGLGKCAAEGETACVVGEEIDSCTPGTPAADDASCDGVDDDCDGQVDEDVPSQPTGCGQGACAAEGEVRCVDGVEQDSCTPGTPAADDASCDGVDDDCDGQVDEDGQCEGTDGGPSDGGPGVDGGPSDDGGEGCGCRTSGRVPQGAVPLGALVLLAFVGLRR